MKLLFGIHLIPEQLEKLKEIVKENIRTDPNTFFFHFTWPPSEAVVQKLKEDTFKGIENRFIEISPTLKEPVPNKFIFSSKFAEYFPSLNRELKNCIPFLGKKEKVEAISFGGTRTDCYAKLNIPLHFFLKKVFGNHYEGARTYLPLVYGKPPVRNERVRPRLGIIKRPKITKPK
jgi:hypothetical protein